MPRWCRAVPTIHRLSLPVATVPAVVAPGVAQVDAPDERDVVVGPVTVSDHDELLMMRAAAPHPLVEQGGAAGLVDVPSQPLVLLRADRRAVAVRAPEKGANVDAPSGGRHKQVGDRRAVRRQKLVSIAAPIREPDEIACAER